jgi:hypothetical protein
MKTRTKLMMIVIIHRNKIIKMTEIEFEVIKVKKYSYLIWRQESESPQNSSTLWTSLPSFGRGARSSVGNLKGLIYRDIGESSLSKTSAWQIGSNGIGSRFLAFTI